MVSSAYLRLLIFFLAILIPACASSSLEFYVMYSALKLNKQADNILLSQLWNSLLFHIHSKLLLLDLQTGFSGGKCIYIYIYIYEKEYIYIHGLSNTVYYRILNIVPCAHLLGPCCFSALYIILWFVSADSKLLTLPPSLMAIYFLTSVLKLFIVWCTNMFNTVWTQIVINRNLYLVPDFIFPDLWVLCLFHVFGSYLISLRSFFLFPIWEEFLLWMMLNFIKKAFFFCFCCNHLTSFS